LHVGGQEFYFGKRDHHGNGLDGLQITTGGDAAVEIEGVIELAGRTQQFSPVAMRDESSLPHSLRHKSAYIAQNIKQNKKQNKSGGIEMTGFLIAAALSGLILGRFFKVYVLVPACAFVAILAFTGPCLIGKSPGSSFVELIVLLASLQFGYVAGLMWNHLSTFLSGPRRLWASLMHAVSSRTLHVR
jgi:hypothetical protein